MSIFIKCDATGAVTLPADLCRAAGLVPGTELVAGVEEGKIIVGKSEPSLAEQIVTLARNLPPEFQDRLPADGAACHDRYLHGMPNQSE